MRAGTSLFAKFPDIEPLVKQALIKNQYCQYCSHYPPLETSFDCPHRHKTVCKRSTIRLFCFSPITDYQFEENALIVAERKRRDNLAYILNRIKNDPTYPKRMKALFNARHPGRLNELARLNYHAKKNPLESIALRRPHNSNHSLWKIM